MIVIILLLYHIPNSITGENTNKIVIIISTYIIGIKAVYTQNHNEKLQ